MLLIVVLLRDINTVDLDSAGRKVRQKKIIISICQKKKNKPCTNVNFAVTFFGRSIE